MSKSLFSNGPWTADVTEASFYIYNQGEYVESGGGFDIRGLNNQPIATGTWRESNKQSVASNARLLAAAPDLYEALLGAQEELRLIRMKDTNAVYDPTIRIRIEAALAKAAKEPK